LCGLGLPALARLAEPLHSDDPDAVERFFRALMQRDPDARTSLARSAAAAASEQREEHPAYACVDRLAAQRPGDIGILAPLFLNALSLAPGEALFLAAGELHAYLSGVAVEVMANSDNVLRGGLTAKPVNVAELMAILRFDEGAPPVLRPNERPDGSREYDTPAPQFRLRVIELAAGARHERPRERSAEIVLCVEGSARLRAEAGPAIGIERGEAAFVPAAAAAAGIEAGARGARLYCAGAPL
jgi:mannose-6-phosphate isomerase